MLEWVATVASKPASWSGAVANAIYYKHQTERVAGWMDRWMADKALLDKARISVHSRFRSFLFDFTPHKFKREMIN